MSTEATEVKVRPFSCGTQFADWKESNCWRCKKQYVSKEEWHCDIEKALDVANICGGDVTAEIARRMGITPENELHYVWQCGEVEWTEEWKAECYRRHPEAKQEA